MRGENFYNDFVNFGESLKILRKRKGYTQSDLAKKAGIDRKHLSDLELGKHGVGLEISLRLCNALKVNRFELLVLAWEDEYKEVNMGIGVEVLVFGNQLGGTGNVLGGIVKLRGQLTLVGGVDACKVGKLFL